MTATLSAGGCLIQTSFGHWSASVSKTELNIRAAMNARSPLASSTAVNGNRYVSCSRGSFPNTGAGDVPRARALNPDGLYPLDARARDGYQGVCSGWVTQVDRAARAGRFAARVRVQWSIQCEEIEGRVLS